MDDIRWYPKGLAWPESLEALVRDRTWPRTPDEAATFGANPIRLSPRGRARLPREKAVCLYPLPLLTPKQRLRGGEFIWRDAAFAPSTIDWNRHVVLGDFGLGSDAPILLQHEHGCPTHVLRLDWRAPTSRNCWVKLADSFDGWLGLLRIRRGQFAEVGRAR